jgi:GalNAc-alpha-(1->4)-GalNAc-alpha-(1->3)-diNAcBac-PP-undecaprenol alpha-1,4-N-acetyl-D-galactosaminyltransferase
VNGLDTTRNVLLVIPGLTAGGAERVATLLAGGLTARGHRVTVATIFGSERDFYELPTGVERICLDLGGDTSRLVDKVTGNTRRIAALRRVVCRAEPDVLISVLAETNVLAIFAAMGLGVPVIVNEQVDPRHHPLKGAWRMLRRVAYARAARLVSCSAGVDAAFGWVPAERRVVIYNPVNVEPLDATEAEAPSFGWAKTIVAMGRLERQKGFDLLVDAFGRVAGDFPDWGLAIFGEGSLRAELTAQIERLGIPDRVRLPGTTGAPGAVFRRGDLFVLSSRYEGFGLTLVEAMACGLPVIAANCPSGPSEIIDSGRDGVLVRPEDAAALAEAMARLMSDDAERWRLGETAKIAARRFNVGAVVREWERVIDECLAASCRKRVSRA